MSVPLGSFRRWWKQNPDVDVVSLALVGGAAGAVALLLGGLRQPLVDACCHHCAGCWRPRSPFRSLEAAPRCFGSAGRPPAAAEHRPRAADALVPEGLEDISLEGPNPQHFQIKSRQRHLGRFPVGAATAHIADSWRKKANRPDDGSTLVVVLERGVKGEDSLSSFDRPLADSLQADSQLRRTTGIRALLYAGRPNWDLLPTVTPHLKRDEPLNPLHFVQILRRPRIAT